MSKQREIDFVREIATKFIDESHLECPKKADVISAIGTNVGTRLCKDQKAVRDFRRRWEEPASRLSMPFPNIGVEAILEASATIGAADTLRRSKAKLVLDQEALAQELSDKILSLLCNDRREEFGDAYAKGEAAFRQFKNQMGHIVQRSTYMVNPVGVGVDNSTPGFRAMLRDMLMIKLMPNYGNKLPVKSKSTTPDHLEEACAPRILGTSSEIVQARCKFSIEVFSRQLAEKIFSKTSHIREF